MEKDFNGIVFRINGLSFSIDAIEIREIVAGTNWKPLSVEGEPGAFLEIRGKVARVLDLRRKLGFSPSVMEGINSFIAVQAPGGNLKRLVALWVDEVLELVNVSGNNMVPPPPSLAGIPSRYLRVSFEYNGEPAAVLNLPEILKEDFSMESELALQDKAS